MIIGFGHGNFERAVSRFEKRVIREIKRVVAETAEMIVSQAKALAPVDDGSLKASISVDYMRGGLTAHIQVGSFYGIFVEFGTGIYSTEGNGRQTPWVYFKNGKYYFTRGMRAQPYWGPAIEVGSRHFASEMNRLG